MTPTDTHAGDGKPNPQDQALLQRRSRVLGPAYRLFYDRPLHVVRGEGVWLWDSDGRRYLDAYNNVASLGHGHPAVVAAVSRQMTQLNTHTRYLHEGIVAYSEALLQTFPASLENVMLTCTGSEANDLALRIAFTVTGGTGIIVTRTAYHGVTVATAGASPALGAGNALGPGVWTIPPPPAGDDPDVGETFADGVRQALEDMRRQGLRPAALLLDSVFSSDGVRTSPPGFLREAVEAIRQAGGLFIADEVQGGFARTGSAMWGFARHGVEPDLVTLGKPMGNGHPIGGVVARSEHTAAFGRKVRYFNTFGGNPVSCAAAMAVLDAIRAEGLQANSAAVGRRLRSGLHELSRRHSCLGQVRGDGLFVGVEILRDGRADADDTSRIVNLMRDRGVLISATGAERNVLKIRPPLILTASQADLIVESLADVAARLS